MSLADNKLHTYQGGVTVLGHQGASQCTTITILAEYAFQQQTGHGWEDAAK